MIIKDNDEVISQFNQRLIKDSQNAANWEKRAQMSEIKCSELEKRLEENLFNRKTLEMLSVSQKL